ncbi:NUDIX hydrolase [Methylobacterium komagatae]
MSPPIRHIARAIVLDPADRLLLIAYTSVHTKGPDGEPLRFWFMPGGGLEPGEDHVTACARELGEEIGRSDVTIGPQIASCDGPFHLFKQSRDARERYFLVRLPDDRIDTSLLAETEDNPVQGTRWWTLDELQATRERIEPAGLARVVAHAISGTTTAAPTVLHWHEH